MKKIDRIVILIENKGAKHEIRFEEKIYLGVRTNRTKPVVSPLGKATFCYEPSGETKNIDVILTHRSSTGREIHLSCSTVSENDFSLSFICVNVFGATVDASGDTIKFVHVVITD